MKDIVDNFTIHFGNIKFFDVADGPGVRIALYVSGCPHACEGCHNKESWDYNYGKKFTNDEMNLIIENLKKEFITGFSILGGEPLDPKNRPDVYSIIKLIKEQLPDKNIWVWTGYTWEELMEEKAIPQDILKLIDVIVDGRFILSQRNISLKYRGSPNQRVIDVQKTLKSNSITYYCD